MFVAGVVLTFALAIGANAAMFGLVARLMLSPPPGVRAPEHVSRIHFSFLDDDGGLFVASTSSYPAFHALHQLKDVFDGVAATRNDTMLVGRTPDIARIAVLGATGDYFSVLATPPAAGRYFGPDDDQPPSGNAVVVLGYTYWQRAFGGERSAIGRQMIIDDQPFTVIGVAPRGFNGDQLAGVDAFMPLSATMRASSDDWITNRDRNFIAIIARVRDGVAPSAVRSMAAAAVREDRSARGRDRTPGVELAPIIPGKESRQTTQGRISLWLAAVSLIVLLIATANVGTLLSLRCARRRTEIAVRLALGAGRGDLGRQLLIESLLLAVIGAAVGLLVSKWFADVVRVTLLPNLAAAESFVDSRVLAGTVVAAALAGILAGLAPLAQARRTDLSAQLRSGGSQKSGPMAFQSTLVTVQVALCTLLLMGAALFVRSLHRVQTQDLGFSTEKLLYVQFDFRDYVPGVERDRAYFDAVQRLRALPQVSGATVAAGIPFGPHNIPPVSIPGLAWPPGQNVQIPIMYGATPEYLDLMKVTLTAGRSITAHDVRGSPAVVLVNETLARTAWPGQSALGKCVRVGFATFPPTESSNPADGTPCREVVGVVRDSRARSLRTDGSEARLMQYYVPFDQLPETPIPDPSNVMGLVVRVTGDIDRDAALVQRAIQSASAVRIYARTRPYQDLIDPQLRSWRLGATLFSAFGVLALGIAAVGLFGVVSYVVSQRIPEIGVRLALGGSRRMVAGLVVKDALRMVSIGVVIGMVAAFAGGPLVASMLFQTSPHEPASVLAAGAVLLLATIAAAALPAWRAGRVDPVVALRTGG